MRGQDQVGRAVSPRPTWQACSRSPNRRPWRGERLQPMDARPICCDFDVRGPGGPPRDELLAEPAVRLLMSRDGVDEAALRRLAAEIRERAAQRGPAAAPGRGAPSP